MAFIRKFKNATEINVTNSVGRGCINSPEDVLVVQALLQFVCGGLIYFAKSKIPDLTGYMDPDTIALIERFQKFMRYRLRKMVAVDGRVERAIPAAEPGLDRIWTIRSLNTEAMIARMSLDAPGENYIQDLCRRFPEVRMCLGRIPNGMLSPSVADIRLPTGAPDFGTASPGYFVRDGKTNAKA